MTLANGERAEVGGILVEAVPSYGTTGEAAEWHPRGRGNGYVATVDERRVYVAGSTQVTPEMESLEDVYLALLPLYPPYAASPEEAAHAVSTFLPTVTFIYQYSSTAVRDEFLRTVADAPVETTVVAPDIGS